MLDNSHSEQLQEEARTGFISVKTETRKEDPSPVQPSRNPDFDAKSVNYPQERRNTATEMYTMGSDDELAFEQVQQPETPSKPKNAAPFTTPSKRKYSTMFSDGLPTPVTGRTGASVHDSRKELRGLLDLVSPDSTPTPVRTRDALIQSPPSEDLYTDLLKLLEDEGERIKVSSKARMKALCDEYAWKATGLSRS